MLKKIFTAIICGVFSLSIFAQNLHNDNIDVEVDAEGKIVLVKNNKVLSVFRPDFKVIQFDESQKISLEKIHPDGDVDKISYRTIAWNRETDLFKACSPHPFEYEKTVEQDGDLTILFKTHDCGELVARIQLGPKDLSPLLKFCFVPSEDGYYSIGYTGSEECSLDEAEDLWQPLIWTQKRFPGQSYLTPDCLCSLPLVAVTKAGISYGVIVDPDSFPFNPLPTVGRYRFGVCLRNADGKIQPMVWAPIPGTKQSYLEKGKEYEFGIRLYAKEQNLMEFQEEVALNMYGLSEYKRDNQLGVNLNTTFDNMVDYGMSQYSWFISELKGSSYETDVKNSVKNSTSLNPLNISFVTDDKSIYDKRFLPMCEFMLSRNSLLFSVNKNKGVGTQKPQDSLGKPVMNPSEAAGIFQVTGKQSPFLLDSCSYHHRIRKDNPAFEINWRTWLAFYNATKDEKYLEKAEEAADQYISEVVDVPQEVFDYKNHGASSFWDQLAPKYIDLYNLYKASGKRKYLEASRYAAHRYIQFLYMCPAIPKGKTLVNEGNKATQQKPWGEPIPVPEESVDNWRLSEIGLHCECAGTSVTHRAIFVANHGPYLLNIAHETGDEFLARIANWAIVGRYANFPGYHINTDRTTAYEKDYFPMRTHYEMNVNSMHYNHVWPSMSIVLDYLISEICAKSNSNIHFPSIPIEAFANLGSQMYGFEKGQFYHHDVTLWMPQRLLRFSNPQLNYLTARSGTNKLYVAISNQSSAEQRSSINWDSERMKIVSKKKIHLLSGDKNSVSWKDGQLQVTVPADGLIAFCIENVDLNVQFQEEFSKHSTCWSKDHCNDGCYRSMIFNFGGMNDRFYSYIACSSSDYKRVGLSYRINNGKWIDELDCVFPFEFSIDLPESTENIEFKYVIVDKSNKAIYSDVYQLTK